MIGSCSEGCSQKKHTFREICFKKSDSQEQKKVVFGVILCFTKFFERPVYLDVMKF